MVALRVTLYDHAVDDKVVHDALYRCFIPSSDICRTAEGGTDLAVEFSVFADRFVKELGDKT